jgi:hypothetical protein
VNKLMGKCVNGLMRRSVRIVKFVESIISSKLKVTGSRLKAQSNWVKA